MRVVHHIIFAASIPLLGLLIVAFLLAAKVDEQAEINEHRGHVLNLLQGVGALQSLLLEDRSLSRPRVQHQWTQVVKRLREVIGTHPNHPMHQRMIIQLERLDNIGADNHDIDRDDPHVAQLVKQEFERRLRVLAAHAYQDSLDLRRAHEQGMEELVRQAWICLVIMVFLLPLLLGYFQYVLKRDFSLLEQSINEADPRGSQRLPSLRTVEINRVGQSFNELLDQLGRTMARRDELDAEVKARALAEEQLRRSNADLEQFAYVASHDLQEPLRMVASYTQLIAERYRGKLDDDADVFIGFAVEGAKRMQALISDLLTYSRINTRGGDFGPCQLNEVLAMVRMNLQQLCEERGAIISCDDLPEIVADRTQMQQLLQNTISNGIKFCPDHGPIIHVWVEQDETHWFIKIKDNGIGIEEHHQERIFEVFQRLNAREQYPGTGIGLAVCKRVMQRHDGKIYVDSEPGQGSVFTYAIPKDLKQSGGQVPAKEQ